MGKYTGYKTNPEHYRPCLHSEISALIKLGEQDCSRYTFVNVRIDNNNKISLAKPCQNCQRILDQVGYKRIIYSSGEKGFAEIRPWFFFEVEVFLGSRKRSRFWEIGGGGIG
jgi:deoxycytidylate deaminase